MVAFCRSFGGGSGSAGMVAFCGGLAGRSGSAEMLAFRGGFGGGSGSTEMLAFRGGFGGGSGSAGGGIGCGSGCATASSWYAPRNGLTAMTFLGASGTTDERRLVRLASSVGWGARGDAGGDGERLLGYSSNSVYRRASLEPGRNCLKSTGTLPPKSLSRSQ